VTARKQSLLALVHDGDSSLWKLNPGFYDPGPIKASLFYHF